MLIDMGVERVALKNKIITAINDGSWKAMIDDLKNLSDKVGPDYFGNMVLNAANIFFIEKHIENVSMPIEEFIRISYGPNILKLFLISVFTPLRETTTNYAREIMMHIYLEKAIQGGHPISNILNGEEEPDITDSMYRKLLKMRPDILEDLAKMIFNNISTYNALILFGDLIPEYGQIKKCLKPSTI